MLLQSLRLEVKFWYDCPVGSIYSCILEHLQVARSESNERLQVHLILHDLGTELLASFCHCTITSLSNLRLYSSERKLPKQFVTLLQCSAVMNGVVVMCAGSA